MTAAAGAAPAVIHSFGNEGGILGLVILALLAIVGLVVWIGGSYMKSLLAAHEARITKMNDDHTLLTTAAETRHRQERDNAEIRWSATVKNISDDLKTALADIHLKVKDVDASVERLENKMSRMKGQRIQ